MAAPLLTRLPLPYDAWFASKADRGAPGIMLAQGSNRAQCWAYHALLWANFSTSKAQRNRASMRKGGRAVFCKGGWNWVVRAMGCSA